MSAWVTGLTCMTTSSQPGTPLSGNRAPDSIHSGNSSTIMMAWKPEVVRDPHASRKPSDAKPMPVSTKPSSSSASAPADRCSPRKGAAMVNSTT